MCILLAAVQSVQFPVCMNEPSDVAENMHEQHMNMMMIMGGELHEQ
jgi:hypothetical protein